MKRVRVEIDPENAGRGPIEQFYICGYRRAFGMPVTRLELNVANKAPILQREIIASTIDLGAQDRDIRDPPEPEGTEEIAQEYMLDQLLSRARVRVMQRVDLRNLILTDLGHPLLHAGANSANPSIPRRNVRCATS